MENDERQRKRIQLNKNMQKALGEGCSGFVRKSIDIDELPKQVAEHIIRASSTD